MNDVKHNYVSINGPNYKYNLAGKLSIPKNIKNPPVVIIAHGSCGVDERGDLYTETLNNNGFATLEIDMWSCRGLNGGLSRPQHVKETLPDIFVSIEYLKKLSEVDSTNIGMIGFSWGGVMSMLLSEVSYNAPSELKALVANYPICWGYNKIDGYKFKEVRDNTNLLLVTGNKDLYDKETDCIELISSLNKKDQERVRLLKLKNATHAFDRKTENTEFYDPYAFQGKGGDVPIKYDAEATDLTLKEVVDFFNENLKK